MKPRVQKVYKKLPPHTYEAHPITNAGEASKPLIIGIITIVAVVILSLLLLFSDQLIGKAFFSGQANSAGAEVVAPQYNNQAYDTLPFSLKVRANTVAEVSTLGFALQLPPGVNCANVDQVQNLLGWDVESKKTCDANTNQIIFEYATFGVGKSGTFDVAQIDLTGVNTGSYNFDFLTFEAFDANNNDVIQTILDPSIEVTVPACGDGAVQLYSEISPEQCDDGNAANGDGCSATCQLEACGDGVQQPSEGCDDANTLSGDGCSAQCQVEVCGDGIVSSNEQCDDSNTALESCPYGQHECQVCNQACQYVYGPASYCGDGNLDGGNGELCDDGNYFDGDGCSAACQSEASQLCGNGMVDSGYGETCDDANNVNGDGCSACQKDPGYVCVAQPSTCTMCGNGVREGGEQCDGTDFWNNQNSCQQYNGIIYSGGTLGCNNDCTYDASNCALSANCGNGNLDQGEGCDDGNLENGDSCSAACVVESACGNGVLNLAEGCDDGNSVDGDGCSSICTLESLCGNGVVNQGEQCDDGNIADNDGCSSVCEAEAAPPVPPENPENPPEEDLFTVEGTKIILTDLNTVNDTFATRVEAMETFGDEIIIYTVLYGPNNKVLSIKSEKVENGLSAGQTYTAKVNYPQSNVKSKSVLVFDVEQAPSVFGQLQKSYE